MISSVEQHAASESVTPVKEGNVSIDSVSSNDKDQRFNANYVAHAYSSNAYANDTNTLRRLFSFLQLLAFALTFMESWEVMAMYVY